MKVIRYLSIIAFAIIGTVLFFVFSAEANATDGQEEANMVKYFWNELGENYSGFRIKQSSEDMRESVVESKEMKFIIFGGLQSVTIDYVFKNNSHRAFSEEEVEFVKNFMTGLVAFFDEECPSNCDYDFSYEFNVFKENSFEGHFDAMDNSKQIYVYWGYQSQYDPGQRGLHISVLTNQSLGERE
ncbi:MAG: hypothetical protein KKB03_01595 [Nanoarchaeota archaeon]|nr:hypothetical protein [Nanoarchaeota archaeon]MBU1135328.1 hypothetical protein [Nanoarchaeota archaeon]MBU2519920.1 hypothetical protein [Nanoarchaeota archaeon]